VSEGADWWVESMGLEAIQKQPNVKVGAWLITWDGKDDKSWDGQVHPSIRERGQVVAVLNPDLPTKAIRFFVERLYAMFNLSASEQIDDVAQPAHWQATPSDHGDVRVGHEPQLWARLVEDLWPVNDKDWAAGDDAQLNEFSWTEVFSDGTRRPMKGYQR
jgi:hypothetical protein